MAKKLVLTDEQVSILRSGMMNVWNCIASDVYEMGDVNAELIVEMCFDADRMIMFGNNTEAQTLFSDLNREYDYDVVLRAIARKVDLT